VLSWAPLVFIPCTFCRTAVLWLSCCSAGSERGFWRASSAIGCHCCSSVDGKDLFSIIYPPLIVQAAGLEVFCPVIHSESCTSMYIICDTSFCWFLLSSNFHIVLLHIGRRHIPFLGWDKVSEGIRNFTVNQESTWTSRQVRTFLRTIVGKVDCAHAAIICIFIYDVTVSNRVNLVDPVFKGAKLLVAETIGYRSRSVRSYPTCFTYYTHFLIKVRASR